MNARPLVPAAMIAMIGLLSPGGGLLASAAEPVNGVAVPAGHYVNLGPGLRFAIGDLPRASPANPPQLAMPFHTENPSAYRAIKAHPRPSTASLLRVATAEVTGSPTPRVATPAVTPPFPLITHDAQQAAVGADVEPPDTQVAAGPNFLMETVNVAGGVFDKKTGAMISTVFKMGDFFHVPAGWQFTDSRLIYDRQSGRWFVSGLGFSQTCSGSSCTSNGAQVYIAVSSGADPGIPGLPNQPTWSEWTLYDQQLVCDQPQLGMSADKVVVSCAQYDSSGANFTGQITWILNKPYLLAGQSPVGYTMGPDATRFTIVPAISVGDTNTAWLSYHSTMSGTLGVMAVKGSAVPNVAGNVTISDWKLAISPTAVPPPARQPVVPACTSVTTGCLDTGDDRLTSAYDLGGLLWTAGDDACTPTQDTAVRSCLRLTQVDTRSGVPSISQQGDYGAAGKDVFYPAVTFDAFGDTVVSFSLSSAVDPAGVQMTEQPAGSPNTFGPATLLQAGVGPYSDTSTLGTRWGDYSAATPDPCDPSQAWLSGEYTASAGNRGWGTATAAVAGRSPPFQAMDTVDAYGGLHPATGCAFPVGPSFGSRLARAATFIPGQSQSGYVLDAYGGMHPFGGAPPLTDAPYFGFDIARDAVVTADPPAGPQGYILDGWGGLHEFGGAPPITNGPYFRGHDIAKRLAWLSDGKGGYLLDGWGGIHPFAVGGNPLPALMTNFAYFPNFSIARDFSLLPNSTSASASGFTLDGWGGLHPLNAGLASAPTQPGDFPYFPSFDIARSVRVASDATGQGPRGWILDGYNGIHPFGGAARVYTAPYFSGQDVATQLALQ